MDNAVLKPQPPLPGPHAGDAQLRSWLRDWSRTMVTNAQIERAYATWETLPTDESFPSYLRRQAE